MTTLIEAAVARDCPHCKAQPGEWCINTVKGTRAQFLHSGRSKQLCQEQFLRDLYGADFCAKLAGHRGQHATLDGSLRWSKGAGYDISDLERLVKS